MSNFSLNRLPNYNPMPGPVVLAILDGIGIGKHDESDGVHLAYTPNLDALMEEPLYAELQAHGTAVGLPTDEDMGNSEVGHNALGAGRVFAQGARRVNEAVRTGAIFEGDAWRKVMERAQSGGTVHFIGLLSDGNVHSHIDQLFALLGRCAKEGVKRVRLHTLADGRDVAEKSVLTYLGRLSEKLQELASDDSEKDYAMASGGGRMVTTMDRYGADWSVVENGWKAHVLGEGRQFSSAQEAVQTYYDEDPDITDQYLPSWVIAKDGEPVGTIEDGDAVIFFNFRGDRAIEISQAFEEEDFDKFDRRRVPDVFYAGMMEYDGDAHIPRNYLVSPPEIDRTIGQYMAGNGVRSFAVSETQKYGHVTYFWNGNNSGYIDEKLEKYVEIPSDRVNFDLKPWMKAAEITDAVIQATAEGAFDFVRCNYANGDMVGHSGIPLAIRIAVESVDLGLRRLVPAVKRAQGLLIVTADHGNADCMWTEKKGVRSALTAHTLNPVPFIVKDFSGANRLKMNPEVEKPGLSNIAATLLNLLGYEQPEDYDPPLVLVNS